MDCHHLVQEAVTHFGNREESLLKILQYVNQKRGFISKEAMIEIAFALDIASARVYSVASFYHYLNLAPVGKFTVYLCKTISCHMKGRKDVVNAIKNYLKIDFGEMTEDRLFSLIEVNCLGQCDKSPAMMINDIPFGYLTPERVRYILADYQQTGGVNARQAEEAR